jgi:uncharacterized protein DUF5069
MESLDLRTAPPRSPNLELGGLLMLARSIDKVRAMLPGGDLGDYQLDGFTRRLWKALDVRQADFEAAVKAAASDADVVAWLRAHSDPARYPEINEQLKARTVGDRIDDPEFVAKYPVVATLPHDATLLDMLEADDKATYAKT